MKLASTHIHHPAVTAYLEHLAAQGRRNTAEAYRFYLRKFEVYLAEIGGGIDLLQVSTDLLAKYQVWLATTYRTENGAALAPTTQCTAITTVVMLYRWLAREGIMLADPSACLKRPRLPHRLVVSAGYLSLQEAMALVQATAAMVEETQAGTWTWAVRLRNLALIAVALASGRRCSGLVEIRVDDVDLDRLEVRVSKEKGKTGRVLPLTAWAIAIVRRYLTEGRPLILGTRTSDYLFVARDSLHIHKHSYMLIVRELVQETIQRNPDLTDLPQKRISTHSLRVSFAVLMFANGCNIRSLNELLLHRSLETTAQYTPIPLEDQRRALLTHHPRA
jgi:site-specific recombinase XerD